MMPSRPGEESRTSSESTDPPTQTERRSTVQQLLPANPLPRVLVEIEPGGTIIATVDGRMFLSGPIGQDLVGHLVDCIVEQHGGAIDLEVREAGRRVELREIVGEGFLPGEQVAIALVLRDTRAGEDGNVYVMVDPRRAPTRMVDDVILFGITSGTLAHGGRQ